MQVPPRTPPQAPKAEASPAEGKLLALLHCTERYRDLHLEQMRRRETMKLDALHSLAAQPSAFGAAAGGRPVAGDGAALLSGLTCLGPLRTLQLRQTTVDVRMATCLIGTLKAVTGLKVREQCLRARYTDTSTSDGSQRCAGAGSVPFPLRACIGT